MKLIESGGKTFDIWQEQTGIGNGDCVLTKDVDGTKFAMLYYDGLLTMKGQQLPENLNALKIKLSAKIPVFKIRYKPRPECEHHVKFLENTMKISVEKYTV